ncbi:hypothetical protein M231_06445 [Tremella mesenterica]|uniref:Uncharacterized protein n=1 Tax=Tremella mesenterica TaxID=5217 RepID=A0A4Q1BBY8_TREME|nr:hypothetical protein M231_06445 [Tremella mesenterica]
MVWTTAPETSTEAVPRGPPLLTLHEGVYSVSLGMVTLWNIMNSHCHRARMNKTTQTVGNIRRFLDRRRPNGTDSPSHTLDHHVTTRGVHTSNDGSVGQALVSGVTERPGISSTSLHSVDYEKKISKANDFPTHLGTFMPLLKEEKWTLISKQDGGWIDPTDLLDWRRDSAQENSLPDGDGPTGSSQA